MSYHVLAYSLLTLYSSWCLSYHRGRGKNKVGSPWLWALNPNPMYEKHWYCYILIKMMMIMARKFPLNSTWPSDWSLFLPVCCNYYCISQQWFWALFSLANLWGGDTVFSSLLQESPSLWHFMTTRHVQKMTSASGKEKGSRLSTARKSLRLLHTPPVLGKKCEFPILSLTVMLRG